MDSIDINHISPEQFQIIVEKIMSLKSSSVTADRQSNDGKYYFEKIQGNFETYQYIYVACNQSRTTIKVGVRSTVRHVERYIKPPTFFIKRWFCPYLKQLKRLEKNMLFRINNKDLELAQTARAELDEVMVNMFPDIIEKELLGK